MKTKEIRYKQLSKRISELPNGSWRFSYKENGRKKFVQGRTLEDVEKKCREYLKRVDGQSRPVAIGPVAKDLRHIFGTDIPTDSDIRKFRQFMDQQVEKRITVFDAASRFLETKPDGRNKEGLRTFLRKLVSEFGDRQIPDVRRSEFQLWLDGLAKKFAPKTVKNVRGSSVSLFKWCAGRGYLPDDRKTVAELSTLPVRVKKKTPGTWTPEELRVLLENARPEFVQGIAAGAFLGLREAECRRVGWESIDVERRLCIVDVENEKTQTRKIIEVPDAFFEWSGDIGFGPFFKTRINQRNRNRESETARLAKIVGRPWVSNGLRHSFCSYGSAFYGPARTAEMAGHSETMLRSTYRDAKTREQGREWFEVRPTMELKIEVA